MADIRKAAQWLRNGAKVRRAEWDGLNGIWLQSVGDAIQRVYCRHGHTSSSRPEPHHFKLADMLADDWEIAE